jgi:hypothetical protein
VQRANQAGSGSHGSRTWLLIATTKNADALTLWLMPTAAPGISAKPQSPIRSRNIYNNITRPHYNTTYTGSALLRIYIRTSGICALLHLNLRPAKWGQYAHHLCIQNFIQLYSTLFNRRLQFAESGLWYNQPLHYKTKLS